jgi:general secretion pathway protein C
MWRSGLRQRAVTMLRYFFIALAAYFGATAVTILVEYWLDAQAPDTAYQASVPSRAAAAGSARDKTDYSVIFRRNLFGQEASVADGPATGKPTDLALRGTADIEGRGFAVFEDTANGEQDVFAVGERVFDGPKLVSVARRSAVILRAGRRETIKIEDEEVPKQKKSDKPPTKGKKAAELSGIRQSASDTYLIDRREVDHAIENLNSLITEVRAVPFMRDGNNMGFRLFAIKPGSIFERMGLKNGDVVQNVNGTQLTDPSKATGLLGELQTADVITVDLIRQNKPSTLTYNVR